MFSCTLSGYLVAKMTHLPRDYFHTNINNLFHQKYNFISNVWWFIKFVTEPHNSSSFKRSKFSSNSMQQKVCIFTRLLCNLIFFFQEVIRHHFVKIGTRSLLLLESTKNVSSHLNKIMKQRSSLHLSPSRLNQIKTNYRGNTSWRSPCTILMEGNLNPVPNDRN